MKKSNVLNLVSAVYAVIGAITMCMIDHHMGISVLSIICFAGAYGYSEAADNAEYNDRIELSCYEGTGND